MTIKKLWVTLYCFKDLLFSLRGTWHISGSTAHTHTHAVFSIISPMIMLSPLQHIFPFPDQNHFPALTYILLYTMLRNDPCNPCGYILLVEIVWHTNLKASSTPQCKSDSNALKSGVLAGLLVPRVFLIKNPCVHCSIKEKAISNGCQMGFPLPPNSSA